jgi:molecular chaperone GrpE
MSNDTKQDMDAENGNFETQVDDTENLSDSDPGTPDEVTPEELNDLKARAAKADAHWDQLLRLTADFDNYKKRAARERQDAIRFANEALLEKLVPVMDNFDMALQAVGNANTSIDSLRTGVAMIHSQLRNVMTESGLEELDSLNQPFNPSWHEAVSQQETTEVPEGQVVQQLRKGYKLRDRLLRPATVVVARKPASQ